MRTIKQIREEYVSRFINEWDLLPEEIMLEGADKDSTFDSKNMPVMLIFKRVQFRQFPGKQTVALYYSKTLDKYLTIPFGPKGNVNLSEARIVYEDQLNEDWQEVNRKDRTDGLSQKAVNAYRRENPGSNLQTAVTEKNPKGKRAERRKSFCARMGGMKKRLTSAKTANDPDSNINKALRRWNCEESFKQKLQQLREEPYGAKDAALDAASFIPGPVGAAASLGSAYRSWKRGDKIGAALDVAGAIPGVGYLTKGAKAARALSTASKASKGVDVVAGMSKAGKAAKAGSVVTKASKASKLGNVVRKAGKLAGLAATAASALGGSDQPTQSTDKGGQNVFKISRPYGKTKSYVAGELSRDRSSDVLKSIQSQAEKKAAKASITPQSNKVSDIREKVEHGINQFDININGKAITLNNSMAKRIVEVYDSVNTKNKKIVEEMLNEDMDSFKKLLNFSIRN